MLREAWKILLYTSQSLFKTRYKEGRYIDVISKIQVIVPGCTMDKLHDLIGMCYVPVIGSDRELVKKMVMFNRMQTLPLGIKEVHHSLKQTLRESRLAPLPVIF